MKKLYYLLLMVCTIGAFSACSDDDDNNGNNPPQNPVTEYSVPAQGEIGKDVTIKGKGYTAESKIFLKDAKGETEMTVKAHSSVDLVFTVLPTLTAGSYTVVLHQAGHSWDLGSIALVAANPVKDYEVVEKSVKAGETVNVKGSGWADKCRIYLVDAAAVTTDTENIEKTETGIRFTVPATLAAGIYTVMLEQTGAWVLGTVEVVAEGAKKLSKIEFIDSDGDERIYELFYNTDGKIDSIYRTNYDRLDESWKFSYTDTKITLTITGIDGYGDPADETRIFNLEDGVVKTSSSTNAGGTYNYIWTVNNKGFLESIESENNHVTYSYDGDDRLMMSDYEENFFEIYFEYNANGTVENNLAGVDGMAFVFDVFGYPDFVVRLLGIAGKVPAYLPSDCTEDSSWGAYTILYEKSGDLVSKIDLIDDTDFHSTYSLSYK